MPVPVPKSPTPELSVLVIYCASGRLDPSDGRWLRAIIEELSGNRRTEQITLAELREHVQTKLSCPDSERFEACLSVIRRTLHAR